MSRQVEIVVTSTVVDSYEARSYPHEQKDSTGSYPLYRVPVYKILVNGIDASKNKVSSEFMAPRFMPYFNDPARPDPHYGTRGWVNSGLSAARKVIVTQYKSDYAVQNRYSPGRGAIVVHEHFYIHAGPASLSDVGFGSAGCIEIIGNYDLFKQAIADLSGVSTSLVDHSILRLVALGKLIVIVERAHAPDIKASFSRRIRD